MTKAQLYFFNNLYNDKIINESIYEFKNMTYQRAMESQLSIINFPEISFPLYKFKVDAILNSKYDLPIGSRTHIIDRDIMPYYNKKAFINKYGYNKIIPINQIAIDYKTFNHRIMVVRGDNLLMDVSFIALKSGGTIICRPPRIIDDPYHLDDDYIDEKYENDSIIYNGEMSYNMIDDYDSIYNNIPLCDVRIILEPQSDYYYINKPKLSLISNNRIPINQFNKVEISRLKKNNSYSMYYTFRDNFKNLARTTVTIVNIDGSLYFELPPTFIDILTNISSLIEIHIFHDYKKISGIFYEPNKINSSIYYQLPFIKNPSPFQNIRISYYNKISGIKNMSYPLSITGEVANKTYPTLYPNIYDLTNVTYKDEYGYYIEWYEDFQDNANISFDNNLKDYMEYKGTNYASMLVNQLGPKSLLEYEPSKTVDYKFNDYINEKYNNDSITYNEDMYYNTTDDFDNIREYNLAKINELLSDNSLRFNLFFEKFYEINKKYIHISTNGIIEPEIMSRSINNNSDHISNPLHLYSFNEPHTFIKFTNSVNSNRPTQVFIDGKRFIPTHIYTNMHITYVYLPKSKIKKGTSIIIDMALIRMNNKKESSIIFSKINEKLPFPRPLNREYVESNDNNDIIFYDEESLEYNNGISYNMVDDYNSKYNNLLPVKKISFEKVSSKDLLFYNTSTFEYIPSNIIKFAICIHNDGILNLDINDILIEDEKIYIPAPTEGFFYEINADNLLIYTENIDFINMEIGITNTNNYRYTILSNVTINSEIILEDFREDPSSKRIRVYYGGFLLNPNQYIYTPSKKYGENAIIKLTDLPLVSNPTVIVEYIPYLEKHIIGNFDDAKYTSIVKYSANNENDIIDISDALIEHEMTYPINIKNTKFYQNGRRIPSYRIEQLRANNIFKINGISTDFYENDSIIYNGEMSYNMIDDYDSIYNNIPLFNPNQVNIRIDTVENDTAPYFFESYSII